MVLSLYDKCVICHRAIMPGDIFAKRYDGKCHVNCFQVWFDTVGCHAKTQDNLDMTEGGENVRKK